MKTKLVITIDTEEDSWGDYRRVDNSVNNIKQIPKLQALFDQYGAVPTYLVNYPVIMDKHACQILKEIHSRGRCEIGSHCHPWNTPPFEEDISSANSMMCNLPEELVKAKLTNLVAATEEILKVKPTSFRAGRWGLGRFVAEGLIDNGYKVDSSVCPAVDWRDEFGPDFSNAPDKPYRFNPENILDPNDNGKLMEIPASTGFFQGNDGMCRKLRRTLAKTYARRLHLIGLLERLNVLNFRWLSPELSSAADMITLCQALMKKGCPALNISFHSTTLLPGMSPYVRSQKDFDAFLVRINKVLKFVVMNDIEFSTLSAWAS